MDAAGKGSSTSDAAMPSNHPAQAAKQEQPLSLSKKATLIMLASLGVTLLVTGATGSRMLKTGKVPLASAKAAAPVSVPSSTTLKPSSATGSSLAPGSTTTAKHRSSSKLRDLFVSSSSSSSSDSAQQGGLDFIANRYSGPSTFTKQAITRQIPIPNQSGAVSSSPSSAIKDSTAPSHPGSPDVQSDNSDPTMDALLDAIKAFGIATVLVFGGSTVLVGSLAWKWGSKDIDSFLATLRDSYVTPFSDDTLKPLMPEYFKEKINRYLSNPEDVQEVKNDEKALKDWFESAGQDATSSKG